MEEILKILDKHLKKYYTIQNFNGVVILFTEDFLPFKDTQKDICRISSYYLASHLTYLKIQKLVKELNDNGISAKKYDKSDLKQLAFQYCNLTRGKNNLLFDKKFGSYFVIGAIEIFKDLPPSKLSMGKECLNCGQCIKKCPTGALNDGFCRDICLREIMNKKTFDVLYSEKLSNNILGCEICQSVCPLNDKVERVEIKRGLKELLSISNILKDKSQTYKELEKYIGKNYSRRTRILNLALNSAKNTKDKSYLPQIFKFLNDECEHIRLNAKLAYEFLSGI